MRLHQSLVKAIGVAIGWAVVVFAVFFGLILWVKPFSSWPGGDQTQLFQAMVSLAGFGGGFVALLFAGQQLADLLADPKLVVQPKMRDGTDFLGGRIEPTSVEAHQVQARVGLEIVNNAESICTHWQVVASAPEEVRLDTGLWRRLSDGSVCYQGGPDEALYPNIPFSLGELIVSVIPAALRSDGAGKWDWQGEIVLTVATQRRPREQRLLITLSVPDPVPWK